jgi:hypothetical protein
MSDGGGADQTAGSLRGLPREVIEAGTQFALFAGLFGYLLVGNSPRFSLLVVYLCGYSVVRFLNDFARPYTHRARSGPFTDGQVIFVLVVVVGGTFLDVTRDSGGRSPADCCRIPPRAGTELRRETAFGRTRRRLESIF